MGQFATRRLVPLVPIVPIVAACLLAAASPAGALTDEELFRDFRFNFINPGARAAGMGGAFVAVADDASAAQANPGGLSLLDAPQLVVELRGIDGERRVVRGESGSVAVAPGTGARDLPFLGVTSVSEPEASTELAFAAVAWPFRIGRNGTRLTVTAARQLLLSDERTLGAPGRSSVASFAFDTFPNAVVDGTVQAYTVDTLVTGTSAAEIDALSLGAAVAVTDDFSFGYTVNHLTLDLGASSATRVVDPLGLFVDPGHPRLPPTIDEDVYTSTAVADDSDVSYTIGVHWHPDSVFADRPSPWRFGVVFRRGASFDVDGRTRLNGVDDLVYRTSLTVPDRFAVGAAYRVNDRWTVAGEAERIEYSDQLRDFEGGVNFLTSGRVAGGAFGVDPARSLVYDVDDGWVPRLGAEYRHGGAGGPLRSLVLRAGYYRRPDARIEMRSFTSDDDDVNAAYLEAFGGGEAMDHVTAGVGWHGGRYAVELAADVADQRSQVVGSVTVRLGAARAGGQP